MNKDTGLGLRANVDENIKRGKLQPTRKQSVQFSLSLGTKV